MDAIRQVRALREVASRTGGSVQGATRQRLQHVQFEVEGVTAWFTGWDADPRPHHPARPVLRVRFAWRPGGLLRIGPETLLSRLLRLLGTRDVAIGVPEFDRRFRIQARPAAWARSLLDAPVRAAIEALADLCETRLATRQWIIDANPAGLHVACWADAAQAPVEAGRFAARAADVLRAFHPEDEPGPTQRAPVMAVLQMRETADQGQCPVCGAGLSEPLQRCGTCRTLHHADCWDYLGGCAVFACGSARPRRAEQRAALRREAEARRRDRPELGQASSSRPASPLEGRRRRRRRARPS